MGTKQLNVLTEGIKMYDVKGRWALITGAARGIGYLSAKFMAAQGCNLILHSRDLKHTEKVLAEAEFDSPFRK